MNNYGVILLGESLIDFVPIDGTLPGRYEAHTGGAPCNVACGLGRLGVKSVILTRVGDDPLGNCILKTLDSNAVDTSAVQIDYDHLTASTVVMPPSESEDMLRYAIYNQDSADVNLEYSEFPEEVFGQAKILHYGSLSMLREKSNQATNMAIKKAEEMGIKTSLDVNLRPNAWSNREKMIEEALLLIEKSMIIKLTKEEAKLLNVNPCELARKGKIVLVTDGQNPAHILMKDCKVTQNVPKVNAVDVTGGGDAFMAAFLYYYLNYFENMDKEQFCEEAIRFCVGASSYAVQNYGAIESLPNLNQAMECMKMLDS